MNNPEVTAYIAALPKAQQGIVKKLRAVVHAALPQVEEQLKWKMPTYGRYAYIRAVTHHVDLGFYYGALLFDPEGKLEGTGKLLRHIKIESLKDVKVDVISRLLHESVEVADLIPGAKLSKAPTSEGADHDHHAGCLHEEPEGNGIYL